MGMGAKLTTYMLQTLSEAGAEEGIKKAVNCRPELFLELFGAGQKWEMDSIGVTSQFLDIDIYLTEFEVPIQHHSEQPKHVGPVSGMHHC